MVNGSYRGHVVTRVTLVCTLVFLSGFWVTNVLLYLQNLGFDPASVVTYYRGAEDEFAMPRTYGSMLEVTHMHLSMMAMVLLLLTHLCIFLPWSLRARVVLVLVTFACALLGESAGWLVRFVHPGFAWLKIAAFVGLQTSLGFLIGALAWYLTRREVRPESAASWSPESSTPPQPKSVHGTAFHAQFARRERTLARTPWTQRWHSVQ